MRVDNRGGRTGTSDSRGESRAGGYVRPAILFTFRGRLTTPATPVAPSCFKACDEVAPLHPEAPALNDGRGAVRHAPNPTGHRPTTSAAWTRYPIPKAGMPEPMNRTTKASLLGLILFAAVFPLGGSGATLARPGRGENGGCAGGGSHQESSMAVAWRDGHYVTIQAPTLTGCP
jgi:hypothetical protein